MLQRYSIYLFLFGVWHVYFTVFQIEFPTSWMIVQTSTLFANIAVSLQLQRRINDNSRMENTIYRRSHHSWNISSNRYFWGHIADCRNFQQSPHDLLKCINIMARRGFGIALRSLRFDSSCNGSVEIMLLTSYSIEFSFRRLQSDSISGHNRK